VALGSATVAASSPAVETDGVDGVTSDAATLNMTVTDLGGEFSVWAEFEYGESGTLDQTSDGEWIDEPQSWSTDIDGLDPNTTYDYRAVVEGDDETVRGDTRSFTTADPNPTVTVSTSDPASVSHCSAALWGDVDEMIDISYADITFEWRPAGASSWNTTPTERFESTGAARAVIDGLSMGTSYEYRITGSSGDETSDTGDIVSFTTDDSPTLKASTDEASDVKDTTAVLNGTIDELGDHSSTDVLFRWGPPSNSGDFPPNTTLEETVSSEGSYSAQIDGLDPSTTYEYWLVASGGDVARGAKRTVTTTGPLLDVQTAFSNDSTDTSITMNGELADLGEASSVDVNFQYRESGASSWSETAVETLSAPDTFTATVDNLPEETEYEYRAVADASDGDTDEGDVRFVSTSGDPEITTEAPAEITDTSAQLRGQVQDQGGTSAEVSFEWGPVGNLSNTTFDTYYITDPFGESYVVADISGLDPGTTYEYRAVIDADDGESDTGAVVSFTTASGPDIDSFSASGGSRGPHADISADWAVSDDQGDLDSVTVEILDGGSVVESTTTSVSGSSASGSESFEIKHGGGTSYDIRLTVTNTDGTSTSDIRTVQT
jgi:subtilisin